MSLVLLGSPKNLYGPVGVKKLHLKIWCSQGWQPDVSRAMGPETETEVVNNIKKLYEELLPSTTCSGGYGREPMRKGGNITLKHGNSRLKDLKIRLRLQRLKGMGQSMISSSQRLGEEEDTEREKAVEIPKSNEFKTRALYTTSVIDSLCIKDGSMVQSA
ncbi:hypothetical protein K439DRAFT_1615993 [Ramaria rubella]|nr:hypothetical protein K439DRAFT_1615993 [Ramaria rubella]